MAEPRTITCESCRAEYETIRANTKYCALCRLDKNLRYIGSQLSDCWACNKKFAPLERGEDSCGECCYESEKPGTAECGFCGDEKLMVRQDVKVCHQCARDPKHRGKFMKAVRNKVKARAESPVPA